MKQRSRENGNHNPYTDENIVLRPNLVKEYDKALTAEVDGLGSIRCRTLSDTI